MPIPIDTLERSNGAVAVVEPIATEGIAGMAARVALTWKRARVCS